MYEVEYADGYKNEMAVNTIAYNLISRFYQDGNCFVLFDDMIDRRTNGAEIKEEDTFIHM